MVKCLKYTYPELKTEDGKKYRQRVKRQSWKIYKIINIKIRLTDKIKIFSRN